MVRDCTCCEPTRVNSAGSSNVRPAKIAFAACNVTKQGMEKREGHAIAILPEATIVPSGVVRLMHLQEQGWSYIRP